MQTQIEINGEGVTLDMGEVTIRFSVTEVEDNRNMQVILEEDGRAVMGVVDIRNMIGALKALEARAERERVMREGKARWQYSMMQRSLVLE